MSSILRGTDSGVGYQRGSSSFLSPTYTTQRSSRLDGLNSHSGSPTNSLTPYDYLPTNKSFSGISKRSPRQSRLRSRSNSLTIYHSKSQRKSCNRSRSNLQSTQDSMRLKSSHSRSSKTSRNIYSRKPY